MRVATITHPLPGSIIDDVWPGGPAEKPNDSPNTSVSPENWAETLRVYPHPAPGDHQPGWPLCTQARLDTAPTAMLNTRTQSTSHYLSHFHTTISFGCQEWKVDKFQGIHFIYIYIHIIYIYIYIYINSIYYIQLYYYTIIYCTYGESWSFKTGKSSTGARWDIFCG